jgi:DNA-binding transcriptional MerR regulator
VNIWEGTVELTISELEEKTGLIRRTIHFFVKEGVIKPPLGLGGAARYGEEHLLRLLLVRELQKSHLKLSGVREALDLMSVEEMRERVKKISSSSPVLDKNALESWLRRKLPGDMVVQGGEEEPASPPANGWNVSFLDIAKGRGSASTDKSTYVTGYPSYSKKTFPPKANTWERLEIVEGVEVLVRSDLVPKYRQLLEEIADRIGKKT